jgi:hypothetical protein
MINKYLYNVNIPNSNKLITIRVFSLIIFQYFLKKIFSLLDKISIHIGIFTI